MSKKILALVLAQGLTTAIMAQSSTKSPYSQFGYGVIAERGGGYNIGMNGLGYALRLTEGVNTLNPASFSNIDSLTFIFDMGLSGQLTNFSENSVKKNAKTASFEYASGAFRIFKNVGMAFGIRPITNVGYKYYNTTTIAHDYYDTSSSTTSTTTYSGSGGTRELFLGIGWRPIKYLSVGVTGSYMWGNIERSIANTYSSSAINSLTKQYEMTLKGFNLEVGAQVMIPVNKKDVVTLGAVYGLGHNVASESTCMILDTKSSTSTTDTTKFSLSEDLRVPHTIGVGIAFNHSYNWVIGVDYSLQKWGSLSIPSYSASGDGSFTMQSGLLKDRHKITVGGGYTPNPYSRKFFSRIRYRAGVSYTSPYIKVNGNDGPKQYSASIGFGIPIINGYNNRSLLNISAQYVRTSAENLIQENSFRINIGLTFNERWFMKWKFD